MSSASPKRTTGSPFHGPGSGHGPAAHFSRKKEKAKDVKGSLSRLWEYLKVQKKKLILVVIIVFAATSLNIAGPILMKIALDEHISRGIHYQPLARLLLIMLIVHLLAAALTLIQQRIMISVAQNIIKELRNQVFEKFQELTIRFFDTRSTGELMSRITNDIENISNTLSNSVLEILSAGLSILTVGAVMLLINWQLGLICLCVIPLVMLSTKQIARFTRKGFRERQKHLGDLNGIIEESITGHRVIKSFVKETDILDDFGGKNVLMKKTSFKANAVSGLMGPLMNMMNNLNYGVTAFAGAILALYGLVSIGTIAAFLNYSRQFSRPLNQVAQLYTSIQSALAGAERVFILLDEKPEFSDSPDALPLKEIEGKVKIKDLHFRYKEEIPVLKGIDIHAAPGQTIALVGPTGAGKTTIINLLTRFYDYQKGEITIDGIDIKKLSKKDLRQALGIVLQETFLSSGTVKENIRYGRLEASDEEIIKAARQANAHQFIHRMPNGYDTPLSENGANLSEGQRQLIAIARAILSNPSILILDEATSSVDTLTEIHIQEGMLKLMEGRTSFVIAHRLSTIKNADAILVMDKGRIIERGTHRELMAAKGSYYNLYHSQFGKDAI